MHLYKGTQDTENDHLFQYSCLVIVVGEPLFCRNNIASLMQDLIGVLIIKLRDPSCIPARQTAFLWGWGGGG